MSPNSGRVRIWYPPATCSMRKPRPVEAYCSFNSWTARRTARVEGCSSNSPSRAGVSGWCVLRSSASSAGRFTAGAAPGLRVISSASAESASSSVAATTAPSGCSSASASVASCAHPGIGEIRFADGLFARWGDRVQLLFGAHLQLIRFGLRGRPAPPPRPRRARGRNPLRPAPVLPDVIISNQPHHHRPSPIFGDLSVVAAGWSKKTQSSRSDYILAGSNCSADRHIATVATDAEVGGPVVRTVTTTWSPTSSRAARFAISTRTARWCTAVDHMLVLPQATTKTAPGKYALTRGPLGNCASDASPRVTTRSTRARPRRAS